jgi:TolA-binding protein
MKINTQREPNENLTDIKNWETQYHFLKEDKRLQEIKVKDAVSLGMQSFDSKNIHSAENLTKLIIKTIQESNAPTSLKKIPNVDALIYNVGMQLFYDKQFKAAYYLFSSGTSFFPQDKNMNTCINYPKKEFKRKNKILFHYPFKAHLNSVFL